ncbi:uncharacterized protein PFL1_03350 [Pseudozyma flocculosa PF-1]|uniref:Uncharacterized protein n=2 Tax=Pseudozyma flocculosa TaxID=84751 RepID=A0A5C3F8S2_9BASI|nr:uncharacterized protein PFL1_03350 [Pseudozyma flocculosa PF-1]EPQ29061.1 hypothetical protein PFL1_03350 [Pseudozyma flocculosa PF-1]SPO40055.1 uncharacterized protein PSFLO_05537 [Pseudozyma flocculosa]
MKILSLLPALLAALSSTIDLVRCQNVALSADVWNTLMMSNNKMTILSCCQGTRTGIDESSVRACSDKPGYYDPNAKCQANACSHRFKVIGLAWCAVKPNADFDASAAQFDADCQARGGRAFKPNTDSCTFENFGEQVDPPAPPPGPSDPPKKPTPDPSHPQPPSGSGIKPSDKSRQQIEQEAAKADPTHSDAADNLPPARTGAYRYALVDYAYTRAIRCCNGADKPHPSFQDYTCHTQQPAFADTFAAQCHKMLGAISSPGSSSSQSGDAATAAPPPSTSIQAMCREALTNGTSFGYGYCRLNFDAGAATMTPAFEKACTAFNGKLVEPIMGSCMWPTANAAPPGGKAAGAAPGTADA